MSVEIKAQNSISMTSVKAIKDATDQSAQLLAEMEQYAEDAGTTLTGIYEDAESAKANAEIAQTSADTAIAQMSVIENIVGVLDLVAENGTYEETEDTEVVPYKWYFIQGGTAPDYVYEVVANPTGDPSAQGWYELTGIDEAIRNYVSAHLVVDGTGVWLKQDGSQAKLQLTTNGIILYDPTGNPIAQYGAETIIGKESDFHIKLGVNDQSGELGFYQGEYKVAYINENRLYINQSVVVEQMDLGRPYGEVDPITSQQIGFGQWSWKIHKNAQNKNNLNLKWIG